jgi:uncharacterized membrane protein
LVSVLAFTLVLVVVVVVVVVELVLLPLRRLVAAAAAAAAVVVVLDTIARLRAIQGQAEERDRERAIRGEGVRERGGRG